MIKTAKKHWKFLLFVLLAGTVGGYCLGLYMPESYSEEMLAQLREQHVTTQMLALSGAVQYGVLYGALLAAVGVYLAEKVGLWREFRFDARAAGAAAAVAVAGGLMLFPGDKLLFGALSDWVREQYAAPPGPAKIAAGLLVGGVIEEVMMRLFFLSLLVFLGSKLLRRDREDIPAGVFAAANVAAALLFAAGHLPGTAAMTALTPVIVLRCFLLNGGFGLAFGRLYRKYGLGWAMAAHGLAHLVADTLMLLFV